MSKRRWVDEMPEILWAYRCTFQSTTQEFPYNMTYNTDVMLPVEIDEPRFEELNINHTNLMAN